MPYYIGKGHGRRAFSKHNNVPLPSDQKNIVVVVSGLSEEAANAEEKRLIAFYGRIDRGLGCLRNRTDGGEGQCGIKLTMENYVIAVSNLRDAWADPEKRSAIIAKLKKPKPPRSEDHTRNARLAQLGKKQSPETIEKRAAAHRGKKRPPFTEEWKRKISEAKKGKTRPNCGSFQRGIAPWNVGKSGYMGANQTSFKPGLIPWNKGKRGAMGVHWTQLPQYRDRFKKGTG